MAEPYSLHASVLSSAAQGDSEQLLRAVQACPEALYARSERGYTAAHLASWAGHVSTLESNSQKSSNSDFIWLMHEGTEF